MKKKKKLFSNNKDLLRYAGLGTQMMLAISFAVYFGLRAGKWLNSLPVFACILPLLTLAAIFYKLMRQTGNKISTFSILMTQR